MKKSLALLCLIILCFGSSAIAQIFSLNNGFANGGNVSTCSGKFKDSNRQGNYNNNENYSVTFFPLTPGNTIELRFDTLALGAGDTLRIFDGLTTQAQLIAVFTSIDGPTSVRGSAANTSGGLTVSFNSDNAITNRGWSAAIICKPPCQKIDAAVFSTSPLPDAQGFINICTGQSVLFKGAGTYASNDLYYHQSDTSSRFSWKVTDNRDTTGIFLDSFRHRFSREGGYLIQLTITDTAGCINNNVAMVKVRTGIRPQFKVQVPPVNCMNDSIRITASPKMAGGSFTNPPVVADSIFLPDGTNVAYQTTLNINHFSTGQTLNNINDLKGILLNMEHSWLGDLEIAIKAPNGTTVRLKYSTGVASGWDSFLGEPVREPSAGHPFTSIAGKGYSYLFSPNPTYGTMAAERGKNTYSYTDNAGQRVTNHSYMPPGSYASEESLATLVGTPLNGQWTISVVDKFAVDNGFIFYWTIQFDTSIYPVSENYLPSFASGSWSPAINVARGSDSSAVVILNSPGTFPFSYIITDGFGCTHDTTLNLVVLQKPIKPNLGPDTASCNGQPINLKIANVQGGQIYTWSNGAAGVTSIQVDGPGTYWVQARNLQGCSISDTIVVSASPGFSVSLGNDTLYCASNPAVLSPVSSVSTTYLWNNGSTGSSLPISTPGSYWVEATNPEGCKVRDSINIADNPINSFSLPPDTAVCELSNYNLTLTPPAGTSIQWSDGTSGYNNSLAAGNHSITANYIGCIRNSQITILRKPLPRISVGIDTNICEGFTVPLRVSFPGATYMWNTGSTDSIILAGQKGTYWAQATLAGCTFRDSMQLAYKNCACDVRMPNAFSPNGDGVNDVYAPAIACFPTRYHLSVFNRYGQLIFESRDMAKRWDGKHNGKDLPIGTYYYLLTFFNVNLSQEEKYRGSITLLR